MSINLLTKYADKLPPLFGHKSYIAGHTSEGYKFDGAKSIVVIDDIPVDFGDYTRSGTARYGTPTDVQDWKQTMTLRYDASVARVIDKGDRMQQGYLKTAGRVVKKQITQKANPMLDKNAFKEWAQNAGQVIDAAATISKSNIVDLVLAMELAMNNKAVDPEDRTLFIKATYENAIRLSTQFDNCDSLKTKFVIHGLIGRIGRFMVVGVPDGWFPTNVAAIGTYKESVFAPVQLKDVNYHKDPPNISGDLINIRMIYDAFVRGALADGVVVLVESGKKTATPAATKGSTTTALASTTNSGTVDIKYTTDGTDPRYSDTAQAYSAAITNPDAGTVIKAVAYKFSAGLYGSDVLEHTCV